MIGRIKQRSFLMAINRISLLSVFLCALLLPFSVQAEKTAPVIMVGSEIDFPPYALVNADGRASGFSVELLEAVAEAMGSSVKLNSGPWPEVLKAFKSGKYDLLPREEKFRTILTGAVTASSLLILSPDNLCKERHKGLQR